MKRKNRSMKPKDMEIKDLFNVDERSAGWPNKEIVSKIMKERSFRRFWTIRNAVN